MWVERLEIRGYKRLCGDYDFDRRLSIICGVNEAGKSSMQDAIVRALFGFSRSERRRYGGSSAQERCAPWNGNPYALHATVNTGGGRLRLEWDLANHEVSVRNLDSGEDLSAQMAGGRGDVVLGDFLLGLELDDFRQACCLDQGAISAVPATEDLVVAMQRAVEAGTGDSGAEAADQLLLSALGDDIGVRRDNLQPKSTGRLAALIDRQQTLEAELERAGEIQDELSGLEMECEKIDAKRAARQDALIPVEQGILRANEGELAGRLRRAREHSVRAAAELPDAAEITNEDQAAIAGRLTELDRLEETLTELQPQVEAASKSVEELEGRRQRLQAEFDGLAAYEMTDTGGEADVQGLIARRDDLAAQAAEDPEGLEHSPSGQEASSRRKPVLALAGILAALSVVAGVLITPAALAGLVLAGLIAYVGSRNPATTDAAMDQRLAVERRRQAVQKLGALDEELVEVLSRAGAGEAQDVEQRARAYLVACERHERWTVLRGDLGDLRGQLTAARQPVVDADRASRRIDELMLELDHLFTAIEIDASNLSAARRQFHLRVERDRELAGKRAAAGEAAEGLATALGDMSMEELAATHEAAEQRLAEHVRTHGELDPGIGTDQLADRQHQLRDEMRQLDIDNASMRAQIRDREEVLPDVPALREEAEHLSREIGQLQEAARAIDIARDVLGEAAREAHRAFRPRLKQALDRNLARITNGRYSQVEIDDGLNLSLIAPETGRMVPADQLSKGTQDQIFFVERLEMIDLLDPTTGEAPLLLDEPFAHFDSKRLGAALQLLAEETHERQVMLFTCDDDLVEAACEACDEPAVIRLEEPQ